MTGAAADLRQEIGAFLAAIQNAGERRQYERVPCALEVQVSAAAGTVSGPLQDISLGGCRFGAVVPAGCGERVTLMAPGGVAIPCRVVAVEAEVTRLQFALDEATRHRVHALLPAPRLPDLRQKADGADLGAVQLRLQAIHRQPCSRVTPSTAGP